METTDKPEKRPHKLNDVQISLLRMFNRNMTDQELSEVKQLLMAYYDEKLQTELDRVIGEKGYIQPDFDKMLNQQNRTAINQEIKHSLGERSH